MRRTTWEGKSSFKSKRDRGSKREPSISEDGISTPSRLRQSRAKPHRGQCSRPLDLRIIEIQIRPFKNQQETYSTFSPSINSFKTDKQIAHFSRQLREAARGHSFHHIAPSKLRYSTKQSQAQTKRCIQPHLKTRYLCFSGRHILIWPVLLNTHSFFKKKCLIYWKVSREGTEQLLLPALSLKKPVLFGLFRRMLWGTFRPSTLVLKEQDWHLESQLVGRSRSKHLLQHTRYQSLSDFDTDPLYRHCKAPKIAFMHIVPCLPPCPSSQNCWSSTLCHLLVLMVHSLVLRLLWFGSKLIHSHKSLLRLADIWLW